MRNLAPLSMRTIGIATAAAMSCSLSHAQSLTKMQEAIQIFEETGTNRWARENCGTAYDKIQISVREAGVGTPTNISFFAWRNALARQIYCLLAVLSG